MADIMATKKKTILSSSKQPTTSPRGSSRASAKGGGDPVLVLRTAAEWAAWLRANHSKSAAVLLQIPKKGAGSTLTYAAALDAALAWGWVDSQKQALDDASWLQRFSLRSPWSPWSKINRAKAEALIASGRMEAPGLAEIERAKGDGRWKAAYDGAKASTVPDDLAEALDRNARAKAFFDTLDAANRYSILYRVQTAKKPETRAERIARFVALCARHETIHPVRKSAAKGSTSKKSKGSSR
ncbi:MAG TPA: YdeI/OmpD-associated family protein [Polyangiaceae bacterium]|nr:YdeI/OmpD-associated family protein [Polyangiaceae bacterium]